MYNDYEENRDRTILLSGSAYKKSAAKALKCRQKGNEYFAKKEWANATELYNKSTCFAEEGSELMGLAYANRASCFFNMKMYSKCLIDIEHAKQNNYPQEKLAKLDERKTICLAAMEKETDRSEMFEPKLDYTPNEMFPCFADVLKIENNHQHGRHVVAKEDIDVGKTVMVDQSYFAETINQKYRRCGNCLRSAENLKPCHKCTFTMFCPRCEENSFHDIECDVNPTYFGCLDFMSFRMVVIRSILLTMNAFDDNDQLIAAVEEMLSSDAVKVPESLSDPQSKYRAFFKLQPNPKEQVDRKLPQKIYLIYRLLMGQSKVSKIFHSEARKRFLMHLIGHHVIVIKN
ncbi:SET and MYND domain-containing protein 4-like [Sitodiplosis mosellana]|uniref:SET and MYND domain-containing protein 4-like n=1 Tax=Sitodiplosis mosellana TaxID=263140 RepID=UPI002443B856|nr:SET and MYND domain-containing protein 4-like [Sitodiplosis mosellana]